MAGTVEGGKAAAVTNKANHGADFYKKIGTEGGKAKVKKGFGTDRQRASEAGRRGGLKSRRTGLIVGSQRWLRQQRKEAKVVKIEVKVMDEVDEPDLQEIDERLWELYVSHCNNNGQRPKYKDYKVWLAENYD